MEPADPTRAPLFDAVLFDLDGTLVATDRYWVPAARAGVRRAFAEFGIEREPPDAAACLYLVGLPLEQGIDQLLGEFAPEVRARVVQACLEEERALLRKGRAALLPGAAEVLRELREAGVRTAIASNCPASYLEFMLDELGLGELVDEARCLDSPGAGDKGDMLADLLCSFGTRSAVMVGDRAVDREAAWANGLPHVHLDTGFAPPGEEHGADARLAELSGLPALLAGRARLVHDALDELGALRPAPVTSVGITGPRAAGKSLLARDAARTAAAAGRPAVVVSLRDLPRAPHGGRVDGSPADWPAASELGDDPLSACCNVEQLLFELLEPHRAGRDVELAGGMRVAAEALLLLEGPFLLDPRVRTRLDRVLALEVPGEVQARRVAGREGRLAGPRAVEEVLMGWGSVERAFERRLPAAELADLCLTADPPWGEWGGAR